MHIPSKRKSRSKPAYFIEEKCDQYEEQLSSPSEKEQGPMYMKRARKKGPKEKKCNPPQKQYANKVSHDYHDCSQLSSSALVDLNKPRVGRGGVTMPFPEKLHELLECIDMDGEHLSIISWQPHGRAFVVHKPKEFVRKVMPLYFRQTKLTSFQRQLNLYGFKRITRGKDHGAYYHELFLRERKELCRLMIRTKVKGTGCKAANNPENEPNFYAMQPVSNRMLTATSRDGDTIHDPHPLQDFQETSAFILHSSSSIADIDLALLGLMFDKEGANDPESHYGFNPLELSDEDDGCG